MFCCNSHHKVKLKDNRLIKEITLAEKRKSEPDRKIDISDIVIKYIPLGCSCKYAIEQMNIYLTGYKIAYKESEIIIQYDYTTSFVPGKDIVITIKCDNDIVSDLYAGISKFYP